MIIKKTTIKKDTYRIQRPVIEPIPDLKYFFVQTRSLKQLLGFQPIPKKVINQQPQLPRY